MEDTARVRKLRWLSRRGMKELDILLERFIDVNRQTLTDGDWPEIEPLLQTEDDVLWDWLQDTTLPGATQYREILTRILRAGT